MRKETEFPMKGNPLLEFMEKAWVSGWLDDYSDDHFLIKTLEDRLDGFVGRRQLIENNLAMYCPMDQNGEVDISAFCRNFCINLSMKLQGMANAFGEDPIKGFITDQMSAGKRHHYNEDTFLQALSEVSILTFWLSRCQWDQAVYEPRVKTGVNNKNPEASFVRHVGHTDSGTPKTVKVNVEVKSPAFPHDDHENEKILIPGVLLTEQGRTAVQEFCKENGVAYLPPRVGKLVDFINSAASKFEVPKENELNLLYINWSYRDYPSNSFLEAASLLTNPHNGLLRHPQIARQMKVVSDAFNKISAIIVYTDSLEGVMFTDFRHVWQRCGAGPRFRICTLHDNIRQDLYADAGQFVFQLTGMNPCRPENYLALIDFKSTTQAEKQKAAEFGEAYRKLLTEEMIL